MKFFKNKSRTTIVIIIILILIIIGIRAYLPIVIQNYVNRTLDRIPEYDGHIGDVDLHLWRGAYNIENIKIVKTTGSIPIPFFESLSTDFSIQWEALFQGKLVGEIELDNAKLNFVSGTDKSDSQTEIDSEWLDAVKDLFPFRINRFKINNGEIHYKDFHSSPKVNLVMTDVDLTGTGFSNTRSPSENPAVIEVSAKAEKYAPFKARARIWPAAKEPQFELNSNLKDLQVKWLNDFLKAYAAVDAEGGTIGFDAEMATTNRKFKGYVKPIIKDVQLFRIKTDSDNPLTFIWEGFVGLIAEIFENQRHDQIATEIPYEGTLDNPESSMWATLGGILENAFIRALKPGSSESVKLNDISK